VLVCTWFGPGWGQRCVSDIDLSGAEDSDFRGLMLVKGALTPPCPSFAMGKPAMVVVWVQGAPSTWDCLSEVRE